MDVGPGPPEVERSSHAHVGLGMRITFAIISSLPDLPEEPHHPLELSFKFPKRAATVLLLLHVEKPDTIFIDTILLC